MKPQPASYSNLVGIPYSEKNCWDIARDFYKQVFNISLKQYFEGPPPDRKDRPHLIASYSGDFIKVDKPKFGDIIIFSIHGIESHIGIFIDHSLFFHSSKPTGSVHDRLDRWKTLIVGYYRHEETPI